MAAAATSCSSDDGGVYTNCQTTAELEAFGWTNDEDVTETITSTGDDVWSATAVHENGGATYTFTTDQSNANAGQVVEQ